MTRKIKLVRIVPLNKLFGTVDATADESGQMQQATRIERTTKNGEMARVPWLDIYLGNDSVVEVRESDCIIVCRLVEEEES